MLDFKISDKIKDLSRLAEAKAEAGFARVEKITEYNQLKVLSAFIKNNVDDTDFNTTTGYGYGDKGRQKLDDLIADIFGTEKAIIRAGALSCGTHTLGVCLYGMLRPGDTMLVVTGSPYDTLHSVIGLTEKSKGNGTLIDFGIKYEQIDLRDDESIDLDAIEKRLKEDFVKMVYIQRSRGYELRHSISVSEIESLSKLVHSVSPESIVMVDNCYGEFTEEKEPTDVGADIMAGSLIKNMGGGIAPSGGYIAGKSALIDLCAYRLNTPGLGAQVGATLGQNRSLFMGIFNAPHVVGEALKTAIFAASLFTEMGFKVTPSALEERHDIIQAICLENSDNLISFCKGMQKGSPVESQVVPEASDMPGYDSKIISAGGAFTSGSTIELSADAPLREPFAVWMQGSLNYVSGKIGVMLAAQELYKKGAVK